MGIQRVESMTYCVEDMAEGMRLFEDWGLAKIEGGANGATFATAENQLIHLRRPDDTGVPAPSEGEAGTGVREICWGVAAADDLEAIAAELGKDRDVAADADGALHARDVSGFAIAFRTVAHKQGPSEPPRINVNRSVGRVNYRLGHEKSRTVHPIRIGHVVYCLARETADEAAAFYLDRLKFRLSDRAPNVGDFMRCEGAWDHHSLGLFWFRPGFTGFDHVAFEVQDMDEVMMGGAHMRQQDWNSTHGPGRQVLGSHVYWTFENPCGGEIEYYADMDRMDESWEPKIWEESPGPPMWRLDTG